MAFQHLRPRDYQAMPWKDGGGVTEQIAIEPPDATLADGFLWRLSMARVERSGPFSRFEGYDRTLLMVEGQGLDLDFGSQGQVRLDALFEPVAFDGAWEARATLTQGPVRDFGVISDHARVRQEVRVLTALEGPVSIPSGPTVWLIAMNGSWTIRPLNLALEPLEALRLEHEAVDVECHSPEGHCLLVRLDPR